MFKTPLTRDRSPKPTLVVDLDETTVRILEVRPSPQGPALTWGATPLDRANDKPYRQAASEGLRKLLTTHNITTRQASLLLSGPSTCALPLVLPPVPPEELANAVRWSAVRVMPFPLEEAVLDHHPLEGKPEDPERTVLVAAVTRSSLLESVEIVQEAGLTPVQVSILPLALGGLIQALGVKPEETTLFVDLRPHLATLIFFRGRDLHLVRTIGPEAATASRADMGTKDAPQKLLNEIWLSLAYYQERFPGEKIHRLWLAGSLIDLERVQPALSEAVGMPVEWVDLSAVLPVGKGEPPPPALAAAAGLLFGPWKLDLLPAEIRHSPRRKVLRTGLRAAAITLLLGTLTWTGIEALGVRHKRQEIAEKRDVLNKMSPMAAEIRSWQLTNATRRRRLNRYEGPLAYNHRWIGALKAFSRLTPPAVRLTALQPDGTQGIKVDGLVFANEQPPEVALSEFMDRLSQSPYFGAVLLVSSREESGYPQRTLAFDLLLRWR